MQLAGRALALDPESDAAVELVTRLMLEPPTRLPFALEQELAETEAATQRRQSKIATVSFAAVAAFLALACVEGVRRISVFMAIAALTCLLAGAAFRFHRHVATATQMLYLAIGNVTLAALQSRAFGSLILAPAVTCVMAVSLTSYPQLIARSRLVVAMLVTSWLTPVALEQVGVSRRDLSYRFITRLFRSVTSRAMCSFISSIEKHVMLRSRARIQRCAISTPPSTFALSRGLIGRAGKIVVE